MDENKNKKRTLLMTEGRPLSLLLQFTPPLLMSILINQVYGIVDTALVGRYLGKQALAGVGSTGSLNFLVMGLVVGICNGFMIPIAQRFGAKQEVELRKTIRAGIRVGIGLAIIMTLIASLIAKPVLLLMNTPSNILPSAYQYICIIFWGIPVTIAANLSSGLIRTLGDSKTPLLLAGISTVTNIFLDIILVTVFHWGVSGAALATILSQVLTAVFSLIHIKHHLQFVLPKANEAGPSRQHILLLLYQGVPMGLQYSVTAIGGLILQAAVNGLGEDVVAAVAACGRVTGFLFCPFDALGTAMTVYAGQNMGANLIRRIREGLRDAILMGAIYAVFAILILIFGGKYLLLMFIDPSETETINLGIIYLRYAAAFCLCLLLVNTIRFVIQGMGYAGISVLSGLSELVARALAALLLVPGIGFAGVCLANPTAWMFADVFLIAVYTILMKKHHGFGSGITAENK